MKQITEKKDEEISESEKIKNNKTSNPGPLDGSGCFIKKTRHLVSADTKCPVAIKNQIFSF